MSKYVVPWGKENLTFKLPGNFKIFFAENKKQVPPVKNLNQMLKQVLAQPIQEKSLKVLAKKYKNILLICDDIGRPTPVKKILPQVLKCLNVQKKIPLIIATGLHRELTFTEIKEKIGEENLKFLKVESHNAFKKNKLKYAGLTSSGNKIYFNKKIFKADLIILIGTLEPHVQAGFGGGLKNILPGVAGVFTIGYNHYLGSTPENYSQVGWHPQKNKMRQDIEEAVLLLNKKIFILNTVLNHKLEVIDIFAGDPILAHRTGIDLVQKISGIDIPFLADLVITNSYPLDVNFRQTVKGIANTLFAAKENGLILSLQRLPLGLDDVKLPDIKFLNTKTFKVIKKFLRILGSKGIHKLANFSLKNVAPEQKFFIYFALQTIRRNEIIIFSPNLKNDLKQKKFPLPVFAKINKALTYAEDFLIKKKIVNPKVIIFPAGGVSYPVLGGNNVVCK